MGWLRGTDLGFDLGWASGRLRLGRLLGTIGVIGKDWLWWTHGAVGMGWLHGASLGLDLYLGLLVL